MTDYEYVISFEKLYKGLKSSCKGIRWKTSTIGYETNALKNTYLLRRDLLNGKYKLQPYQTFKIYEPKERDIVATRIRDRQFQHSMVDNVVYGQLTADFIDGNCACQKGRGVDYCLNYTKLLLRNYFKLYGCEGYYAKLDIKSYFASISHNEAKRIIQKLVRDKDLQRELFRIVDSYPGDKGLGLGSQVNQLIALAILDEVDHFIKEELHVAHYVRYMDDMILVHSDKECLKECLRRTEGFLEEKELKLNKKKTTIAPLSQGFVLLKWKVFLKPSGRVVLKMDRRKVLKQKKKIAKLWALEQEGKVKNGTCDQSMNSFMANARRGDTYSERREVAEFYHKLSGRTYHCYVKRRNKIGKA